MLPLLAPICVAAPLLEMSVGSAEVPLAASAPLGGYTERRSKPCEPGGEKLCVRTLVLRQGDTKIALISAELLTIPRSLYLRVASRLPDFKVMLCATHTHCAPDSQMFNERMTVVVPGIARYDAKATDEMVESIVSSVRSASSFRTVQWMTSEWSSAQLNRSRRPDGSSRPRFFRLRFSDGKQIAMLGNFAAHPTILDSNWNRRSGDWPGEWMRRSAIYETRMLFNGAIGDVSPAVPNEVKGIPGVRRFVEDLDDAEVTNRLVITKPTLKFAQVTDEAPAVVAHPDFAKLNGVPNVIATQLVDKFAERQATVSLLQLSDRFGGDALNIIGVPAEPTDALGQKLERSISSDNRTLVFSFCNGWLGYELTEQQYSNGGYEASLSFHGSKMGQFLEATVRKSAQTLAGEKMLNPAAFQSSKNRFRPVSVRGWLKSCSSVLNGIVAMCAPHRSDSTTCIGCLTLATSTSLSKP